MTATSTDTMPLVRRPAGKGHDLLCDDGFRRTVRDGRPGVIVKIRLPSYRSLPLSCIADVHMSIDGRPIPDEDLTFLLDGNPHRLHELDERIDLWWFVLDPAEIFAAVSEDIANDQHLVEVGLRESVPYATGGKMALSHTCAKRLSLSSD